MWVKSNQNSYFYRSVRCGGQVKRIYFGTGPKAEAEAAKLEADKAARTADRERLAVLQTQLEPLDEAATELDTGVNDLIDAALICEGYHKHRGQWRKWHGRNRPD